MQINVDIIRSKINFKIAHHLAFIVNWAQGDRGAIGTGLFAEISERRFLITAKHVLKGATDDQIYINLGLQDQHHVFRKLDRWENAHLDLAFIELDRTETDFIRDRIDPFSINAKQRRGDKPKYNGLAICGYPKTYWIKSNPSYVTAGPFTIALQHPLPTDQWPQRAKDEYDPEDFFLVSLREEDLGQQLVDQDGKLPSGLDPHGMSGSPVWLFDINTVNNENPDYGFWGILTGYLTYEPNILKCTFINKIIEEFERRYGFNI
jgi:hypothetical protein